MSIYEVQQWKEERDCPHERNDRELSNRTIANAICELAEIQKKILDVKVLCRPIRERATLNGKPLCNNL